MNPRLMHALKRSRLWFPEERATVTVSRRPWWAGLTRGLAWEREWLGCIA